MKNTPLKAIILFLSLLLSLMLASLPCYASGQKLVISIMPSTGEQRTAYHQLIEKFKESYPDISVEIRTNKQELYKRDIETILDPKEMNGDLFFWFAGSRLLQLQQSGALLDLSDWWKKGQWEQHFSMEVTRTVMVDEKQFALPINYYPWGFYYVSLPIFEKNNTFSNWHNFITTCTELDEQGYNLVTIGSQSTWSVAAWFDYLNLRTNGLDFHHKVMQGEISFNDPRITNVFKYWQEAIDANCFTPKRSQLSWKQSLPELYHYKAHSILMGNFFTPILPKRIKKQLKFAPFPIIDPAIARYEEAPMDVIVASINAKNNPAAFTFLNFLVTTNALSELNKEINKIDPFKHDVSSKDPLLQAGIDLLQKAKGISQFFDRDAKADFSAPAMQILANYINGQINMEAAQSQLEKLRLSVVRHRIP